MQRTKPAVKEERLRSESPDLIFIEEVPGNRLGEKQVVDPKKLQEYKKELQRITLPLETLLRLVNAPNFGHIISGCFVRLGNSDNALVCVLYSVDMDHIMVLQGVSFNKQLFVQSGKNQIERRDLRAIDNSAEILDDELCFWMLTDSENLPPVVDIDAKERQVQKAFTAQFLQPTRDHRIFDENRVQNLRQFAPSFLTQSQISNLLNADVENFPELVAGCFVSIRRKNKRSGEDEIWIARILRVCKDYKKLDPNFPSFFRFQASFDSYIPYTWFDGSFDVILDDPLTNDFFNRWIVNLKMKTGRRTTTGDHSPIILPSVEEIAWKAEQLEPVRSILEQARPIRKAEYPPVLQPINQQMPSSSQTIVSTSETHLSNPATPTSSSSKPPVAKENFVSVAKLVPTATSSSTYTANLPSVPKSTNSSVPVVALSASRTPPKTPSSINLTSIIESNIVTTTKDSLMENILNRASVTKTTPTEATPSTTSTNLDFMIDKIVNRASVAPVTPSAETITTSLNSVSATKEMPINSATVSTPKAIPTPAKKGGNKGTPPTMTPLMALSKTMTGKSTDNLLASKTTLGISADLISSADNELSLPPSSSLILIASEDRDVPSDSLATRSKFSRKESSVTNTEPAVKKQRTDEQQQTTRKSTPAVPASASLPTSSSAAVVSQPLLHNSRLLDVSSWSLIERSAHITCFTATRIEYMGISMGSPKSAGWVRSNHPIPVGSNFYYFEVEILNRGKELGHAIYHSTAFRKLSRIWGYPYWFDPCA